MRLWLVELSRELLLMLDFLLEDLAEALADEAGGVAADLAADQVAGEVEEGVGVVAAVFHAELAEVLDTQR